MKKYNLLLFLCIIPTIFSSRIVERRRRPSADQQRSILDQIAQANTWQSPNRVISASYARNPGTGHVNNANLMINILPHNEEEHQPVDLVASQTLSNSQSAAEYVTRALEMRKNLRDKAPHSSYVKYDIYEKEKKQFVRPLHEHPLRQSVTQKPNTKFDSVTSTSKIYENYQTQRPNTKSDTVTRNSKIYEDYRRPDYSDDFGEGEYMYRESNHRYNGNHDAHGIGSDDNFERDVKELTASGIPKAELMKHIEKSVVQYMKRLESEGNLPKLTTHRPHTEVKTYYRLPKLNSEEKELPQLNSEERVKDITYTSTESELFKRPAESTKHYKTYKSPHKNTVTTVSTSYLDEPYSTMSVIPNVDLTMRNKRPKSIDYSALDIGQSWSHGSSLDHHTTAKPKHKPKLKFNSQTYQDINAMTYSAGKGLVLDESSYAQSANQPCTSTESGHHGTKPRHGLANVGASLTVGEKHNDNQDEAIKDLQEHYRKPLQIINGIPVLNPYKVNMETLKHMFGGDPEEIDKDTWQPYSPSDNRQKQSQKETTAASNIQSHQLPFDSYNPKYNNNPEGRGYQDQWQPPEENSHRQRGTIGSDMNDSSSSTVPKKIRTATTVTIHKHKRKKNKTKIIKISPKKKSNLQTELRPPPTQTK
ncbi:uncharacterized protein LOC119074578 isoform X2 [Bradysia coprophila]|uniref:uncharacterized protein LOC119074578 isoform X2 n=1 Tax=Bradysia coprophila TaxID=38358 RepID=UPI00187D7973|nr:uncharacterized protein LOC119074578 isoform X2 [Bradysia coprophila]